MTTWVALLRAVNVGGRNRVSMTDLRAAVASLGHEDVVTLLQSGNVVFSGATGAEASLRRGLERQLHDVLELDVSVLLRSAAELAQVATRNPWLAEGEEPTALHVAFLEAEPAADAVAALDPDRSPPDTFMVDGREIFLRYPNGSGRSKLTLDYLERTLGVRGTARNWNTVTKLVELSRR